jgi:hypothetical protein
MVCFQTKNPNFFPFWHVWAKKNLATLAPTLKTVSWTDLAFISCKAQDTMIWCRLHFRPIQRMQFQVQSISQILG